MDDDELLHELRLPAGTRSVKVADVPRLFATAMQGPPLQDCETDPVRIQRGWSHVMALQEIERSLAAALVRGDIVAIDPVTGQSPPLQRWGGAGINLLPMGSLRELARRYSIRVTIEPATSGPESQLATSDCQAAGASPVQSFVAPSGESPEERGDRWLAEVEALIKAECVRPIAEIAEREGVTTSYVRSRVGKAEARRGTGSIRPGAHVAAASRKSRLTTFPTSTLVRNTPASRRKSPASPARKRPAS